MKILVLFVSLFSFFACVQQKDVPIVVEKSNGESVAVSTKIAGANLENPGRKIQDGGLDDLLDANVGWVAIIPYGYTERGDSKVQFNYNGDQWWGESLEGTIGLIEIAQKAGLKTMIKPHVWVVGDGWPGDFKLNSDKRWKEWEVSYHTYIMEHAKVADSLNVDLFCIGTEYRKAVVARKDFWVQLIKDVREVYSGKLTYASNWDNYEAVTFWKDLDFIGIDTYFPLSEKKDLSIDELVGNWEPISNDLKLFSEKYDRRIIFTEYGFKSVDYASAPLYKVDKDSLKPNMNNQVVGYNAFFQTVWQQDWMAGGFFWKWHVIGKKGGLDNTRYTPQGKPALDVIRDWYGKVEE
ncbi:MAG: hypothetical protein ACI865_002632 [Flavobacteriaceae bacterium]|jgi:hypothetical protein